MALRDKVFRAFPKGRVPFDAWKGRHNMWTEKYADSFNVEFTTEESIRVHGQLFIPRNGKSSHPALIYVKDREDIVFSVDYDHLLSAFTNHVVLVLNPRAVDYPMDVNRTSVTKMTAALLGGTLESMQLWDILRSVDYLVDQEKLNLSSISVYGRKHMGGLALHAAALDSRFSRVILDDPPASHWQGPALLNVLRITDLPEVAGMMAPREIVSLTPSAGRLSVHPFHLQPVWQERLDSAGSLARGGLAGMGTLIRKRQAECGRYSFFLPLLLRFRVSPRLPAVDATPPLSDTNCFRRISPCVRRRSRATSFRASTTWTIGSGGALRFGANSWTCLGWIHCPAAHR